MVSNPAGLSTTTRLSSSDRTRIPSIDCTLLNATASAPRASKVRLREPIMKSIVLLLLIGTIAGGLLAQDTAIRADVNVVSIYFTVRDKGDRLVSNLTKDDFKVLEDG